MHFNLNINTGNPAMDELALAYVWGLNQLGHSAAIYRSAVDGQAINLNFAAMLLDSADLQSRAKWNVIFNLEQVGSYDSLFNSPNYLYLMRSIPTWEYSRSNIAALHAAGVTDTHFVPIGYCPELECITPVEKDIDVLFYGSLNDRRMQLFASLSALGLRVMWNKNGALWTPAERDAMIARSKLVLNVSYFDTGKHVFEEARVSYLLNNRVAVVSEIRDGTYIEDDMRASVAGAKIEDIPKLCLDLCQDDGKRAELAERGYTTFKKRRWLPHLQNAVNAYMENNYEAAAAKARDVAVPKKMQVFVAGVAAEQVKWRYDYLNLGMDYGVEYGLDMVCDFGQTMSLPMETHSWRFGSVKLQQGYFDLIEINALGCADLVLAPYLDNAWHCLAEKKQCMITLDANSYRDQAEALADSRFKSMALLFMVSPEGHARLDLGENVETLLQTSSEVRVVKITFEK